MSKAIGVRVVLMLLLNANFDLCGYADVEMFEATGKNVNVKRFRRA